MGLPPIIRDVKEFSSAKMPADMYGSRSCYRQFLHIDNKPAYKLTCTDYDVLMEKVNDMMCEDIRLNIVAPYSTFIVLNDTVKYDNVFVEKLCEM